MIRVHKQFIILSALAGISLGGCMGPDGLDGAMGAEGAPGEAGPPGPRGPAGAPGTFSGMFAGDVAFTGDAMFDGATTCNGRLEVNDGVSFGGRVFRTAPVTGTHFVNNTVAGVNLCGDLTFHACTAWEAMVIDTISADAAFDQQGWVVGSFPNWDGHMRSLVNGQDSLVCPLGLHLAKYPSRFAWGSMVTPGGIVCASDAAILPIWCCRSKA